MTILARLFDALGNALKSDGLGNLFVTLGTDIAGEDRIVKRLMVQQKYTPFLISAAATTNVKGAPGSVGRIRVIGGTLGNVTIYDSLTASGTVLLATVTPVQNGVLLENVSFATGLTIVTAAATIIVGGTL